MTLTSTVLFGEPHSAIADLIRAKIAASTGTWIVSGFATAGGLSTIDAPIRVDPTKLRTLVIGAATYPAFEALDDLLAAQVPLGNLWVHLGHTSPTRGKNPYARYRPMLHSKIYYMEQPGNAACAFIGSNNLTSFALGGLNSEAAVMLEGPASDAEFGKVRDHIDAVQSEAVPYDPTQKDGYTWWSKQYFEGLSAEARIPGDWTTIRTILIFATNSEARRVRRGDMIYFELPSGIQVENLATQVHLFLFDTLPATPLEALANLSSVRERFRGITRGADNEQGNIEVRTNWRIDQSRPVLRWVPTGTFRPSTPADMQQVRAKIEATTIPNFKYSFEREKTGWDPELSLDRRLSPKPELGTDIALYEARGGNTAVDWRLVTNLRPRAGKEIEKDQAALELVKPEAGAFVLISVRRRAVKALLEDN